MKTFSKLALVACAALAVGLTGCSKETPANDGGDAKSVYLKITRETVAADAVRSVGTHVGAVAVTMNDGYVYFVTPAGAIMAYVQIDFTTPTAPYASNKVGATTLAAGVEITSVPGSVSQVVIVGNLPGGVYPTTGNISQFNGADYVTVSSQYNSTDGGVGKVTLYGANGLTAEAGDNKYSSTVQVEPICARYEIGAVSGDYDNGTITSTIKSFTLDGIYINRFYPTMGITGVNKGTLVNNLSDPTKYNAAVAPSAYALYDKILSDYSAAAIVAQTAAPVIKYASIAGAVGTNVWAYNLLAPASADVPSIIVRVSNVVVDDGAGGNDATTYAGTKFLTVRNIYVDGSSTPLASISKRYVYRIVNLQFAEQHLTPNPEMNFIDIEVTAVLMTWIPKDVTYDFD